MATGSGIGRDRPGAPIADVIAGLNDLLQLDHDAIGAYEIAIEQLANREHALQIEGFKRDHESHIRDLNALILSLGGKPANEPHATAPVKQAIQRIAAAGGDRALLAAWRTNELQVMSKYDTYAQKAVFWPADAKRLVDQNALDEERHYQWVVTLLSGGRAPELNLATRVREGLSRARHFGGQAQEKLGSVAATARLLAADGLRDAAGRLDEMASREVGADGLRGRAALGAQRISRGLDTTAAYLRDPAPVEIRSLAEAQIRDNPGRSLVAVFVVGIVLGRIVR